RGALGSPSALAGGSTPNGSGGVSCADIRKKMSNRKTTLIIGTTLSACGGRGGGSKFIALLHQRHVVEPRLREKVECMYHRLGIGLVPATQHHEIIRALGKLGKPGRHVLLRHRLAVETQLVVSLVDQARRALLLDAVDCHSEGECLFCVETDGKNEEHEEKEHHVDHWREAPPAAAPRLVEGKCLHLPYSAASACARDGRTATMREAAASRSTRSRSITPSNQLSAIAAGIATAMPAAVVRSASQMPPASAEGSARAPAS